MLASFPREIVDTYAARGLRKLYDWQDASLPQLPGTTLERVQGGTCTVASNKVSVPYSLPSETRAILNWTSLLPLCRRLRQRCDMLLVVFDIGVVVAKNSHNRVRDYEYSGWFYVVLGSVR